MGPDSKQQLWEVEIHHKTASPSIRGRWLTSATRSLISFLIFSIFKSTSSCSGVGGCRQKKQHIHVRSSNNSIRHCFIWTEFNTAYYSETSDPGDWINCPHLKRAENGRHDLITLSQLNSNNSMWLSSVVVTALDLQLKMMCSILSNLAFKYTHSASGWWAPPAYQSRDQNPPAICVDHITLPLADKTEGWKAELA